LTKPNKNKQDIGSQFEQVFSDKYNVDKVKASGALPFWKLDADAGRILFSLKATSNESFRVTKKDLDEANNAIIGPGGVGGDTIPGMAICLVENEQPTANDPMYAVVPMDDLVRLLEERAEVFRASKKRERFARASVPELLRKSQEE
jgi:hypothetical protein